MKWDRAALAPTPGGQAYLLDVDRRLRQANWLVRGRVGAIQLSWVVVTIAGAAVSVVEVLDAPRWIGAGLGFAIVSFQGLDRIFGRTTEGSRSLDVLRRDLYREKRLFTVGEGPYRGVEDPFGLFVERSEAIVALNDAEEVAYNARLSRHE